MILGFEECLIKRKEQSPIVTLIIKKDINFKPKRYHIKIENPNNYVYYLNLEYDFFDILDEKSLNELDSIMNAFSEISNLNDTQKKLWKKYKELFSNIKPVINTEIRNIKNLLKETNTIDLSLKKQTDTIDMAKKEKNMFDFYYDKEEKKVHKHPTIFSYIKFENEKDFIYAFLELLYASKNTYSILKCNNKKCNKYFVSSKSDTEYCSRLENDKTCYDQNNIKNKKYSNLSDIETIYRTIKSSLNNKNNSDFETFTTEYKRLKKEQVDISDLLLFLKKWLSPKSKYNQIIDELLKNK